MLATASAQVCVPLGHSSLIFTVSVQTVMCMFSFRAASFNKFELRVEFKYNNELITSVKEVMFSLSLVSELVCLLLGLRTNYSTHTHPQTRPITIHCAAAS